MPRYVGFDYGLPLALSDEMICAVLAGRKTHTIRALSQKEQQLWCGEEGGWPLDADGNHLDGPYGPPGDYLWVRESYRVDDTGKVVYRLTEDPNRESPNDLWLPVVGMREDHSRIRLRVSGYRFIPGVQLLTHQDLVDEGLATTKEGLLGTKDLRHQFRRLWNTRYRNRELKWEQDPPAWITEFTVMGEEEVKSLCLPSQYRK